MKQVAVIGSGFSGLSAASMLAKAGYSVTVFEKNNSAGGRARKFEADGFTFDMGPSWYWMPDVFEHYFKHFGKQPADFYSLQRLDPSYRIYFSGEDIVDVPAGLDALFSLFEKLEQGSSQRLQKFLDEGRYKYEVGMHKLVRKPGLSLSELVDRDVLKGIFRLSLFQSIASYIRKHFSHPYLIQLLEFPVLFLGATPEKTPALYSLMNYADLALGTWYPAGGMHKIVEGMVTVALQEGVTIHYNSPVESIEVRNGKIFGVWVNGTLHPFDKVVASADYHHVEQHLLPEQHRTYSAAYWDSRVLAPSSLILFLGINKRLKGLRHHNLFFDQDFTTHAREIYDRPSWPSDPLFYVCCPSITDDTVAPPGQENLFILIPVAPNLSDDEATRSAYLEKVLTRLEKLTGQSIRDSIVYQRHYAHADFVSDYNAFKGNAYGLANTMRQTANLKPSIVNKNVKNLFYTGQLTVPGPGVPPSIISGQVVAKELIKRDQRHS